MKGITSTMKAIAPLCLFLFCLIGTYSCTPESNEYPKKYNYTSYSVSSGEMFALESDSSLVIIQSREAYITQKIDTFKLILDSFVIGQSNFIRSYSFLDETMVSIEAVSDFGQEVDTITTYYTHNSFIYVLHPDSTDFVLGFKESQDHIVKDFAAIFVKPSVNSNNQSQYYSFTLDDLGVMTMNEYLSNINDNAGFYIGDTVIAMTISYNYDLE